MTTAAATFLPPIATARKNRVVAPLPAPYLGANMRFKESRDGRDYPHR
jgi:hypothetical protein